MVDRSLRVSIAAAVSLAAGYAARPGDPRSPEPPPDVNP